MADGRIMAKKPRDQDTGDCGHKLEPTDPVKGNWIKGYIHCRKCVSEHKGQNVSVGWTTKGLQVWCDHHECNIMHVDFEGVTHPADLYP